MTSAALLPGECHVWWGRPAGPSPGLVGLLDVGERARLGRLTREVDRRRYVAAHALARLVVAGYVDRDPVMLRFGAGCERCGGTHGKPRLVEPPLGLEMSLSHSGDRVVVAVAAGVPLGVDVEQLSGGAPDAGLAEEVLSPLEQRALQALPAGDRGAALLRYWVRKEAVLKATGEGLASPVALLTVSPPDRPAAVLRWDARPWAGMAVQLHDVQPGPGHLGSLALLTGTPHRVVERDGAPLLQRLDTDDAGC